MTTLNEISGVITSPFYPDIILLTKAAAAKSGQERENELYSLLKTWIFLGGAVEYGMNANKKIS